MRKQLQIVKVQNGYYIVIDTPRGDEEHVCYTLDELVEMVRRCFGENGECCDSSGKVLDK